MAMRWTLKKKIRFIEEYDLSSESRKKGFLESYKLDEHAVKEFRDCIADYKNVDKDVRLFVRTFSLKDGHFDKITIYSNGQYKVDRP